jgi:hypothetical protein
VSIFIIVRREKPLSFKKINPIEAVVAPAFSNLEVGGELTDNLHPGVISVIDHLDSIFVLRWLAQALEHFQEYTYVVSLGNPIPIWIDLETPS